MSRNTSHLTPLKSTLIVVMLAGIFGTSFILYILSHQGGQ